MKLTMTQDQADIVDAAVNAVRRATTDVSDDDQARRAITALSDGGFLDLASTAGPLEAALVTEAISRSGVLAPVGARLLVGDVCGLGDDPVVVGLVEGRRSLVRYGTAADVFVGVDGDDAFVAHRDQATITPLAEGVGTPVARVEINNSTPLPAAQAAAVARRWRIAMAAEAAGAMAGAISLTVPYVSQRIAFGRPLGSFQAVQHRLARAQVFAEGTSWLARHAAWADDDYLAACAATYACMAAVQVYENTHQVTGGIGITTEHGLVRHTRRLVGLQRELGGMNAHARRVTASRLAEPTPAAVAENVA
ncbi:acyl-CoA dehydrogenase [Gordonia sp. SID5947]|uniref:acyl-CoA dehydrogenase family protein n=1 Tax=Gordonia sp. SID5947 TaxID=2690315 RepID=UPI001367A847|nr:acyl-CoA dehydrogenase family protein [Gordonia sp. SID5947]MYR08295.1 acyl-CoA dehydrogenase [Gordonia sp. SID5947]